MLYQLLNLHTYCHFSRTVWLTYDQAFHEHAATRLMDWSCMNMQLFNFCAASSAVQNSSLAQSNERLELPALSSSSIKCKSWNKGRCTSPFTSCCYIHHCNICLGAHHVTACVNQSIRDSQEELKQHSFSLGASAFLFLVMTLS